MRALALTALLAGCPGPTPPPAPPPQAARECGRVDLNSADACEGMFAADGSPCVMCAGDSACVISALHVYCAPDCRVCRVRP